MDSKVDLTTIGNEFEKFRAKVGIKNGIKYPSYLKKMVADAFKAGISFSELKRVTGLNIQTLIHWKKEIQSSSFEKIAMIDRSLYEKKEFSNHNHSEAQATLHLKNDIKLTLPLDALDDELLKKVGAA